MKAHIIQYKNETAQANTLVKIISSELLDDLKHKERVLLAVPGGSTPALFLNTLSTAKLPWQQIDVTLTDERLVDRKDKRSNALLIEKNLLKHHAKKARFLALNGDVQAAKTENSNNNQQLINQLTQSHLSTLPIDSCVLGMGDDGHFASIFPELENLAEAYSTDDNFLITQPDQLEQRITFSLNAILKAPSIHLLIQGQKKLSVINDCLNEKKNQLTNTKPSISNLPIYKLIEKAEDKLMIHYCNNY